MWYVNNINFILEQKTSFRQRLPSCTPEIRLKGLVDRRAKGGLQGERLLVIVYDTLWLKLKSIRFVTLTPLRNIKDLRMHFGIGCLYFGDRD